MQSSIPEKQMILRFLFSVTEDRPDSAAALTVAGVMGIGIFDGVLKRVCESVCVRFGYVGDRSEARCVGTLYNTSWLLRWECWLGGQSCHERVSTGKCAALIEVNAHTHAKRR